jgi:hypothetical protein
VFPPKNSNPGAGQYKQTVDKIVPKVQDKMHNAFATNIARFCPTQPDSGLVTGPTWIKSPEPGVYYKDNYWGNPSNIDKTIQKYTKKMHSDLAVIPTAKAPGIPNKKLA